MKKLLSLLFLCFLIAFQLQAQKLKRKAFLGVKPQELNDSIAKANKLQVNSGLLVLEVSPNSTAESLKLKPQDVVTSINQKSISSIPQLVESFQNLRENEKVEITVQRGKKKLKLKGKTLGKPYEKPDATTDVIYDQVKFGNGYLRAIITKPKGEGKFPAILFIPGYNCGSIDNYNVGAYGKLIKGWNEKGYAVMRIEKSGMGDSENTVPCAEVDMYTEIASFETGYKHLKTYNFVDTTNLFMFGHSMGGVIAPVIAEKYQPKGVMVYGTVFRPWFEFMIDLIRKQNIMTGADYVENEKLTRQMQTLFYEFFVLKKSPAEIAQNPNLTALAAKELDYKPNSNLMWGRHYKFWQQLDELNMAQSWRNTRSNVLAIWGSADWISFEEEEHTIIADLVNKYNPGKGTYLKLANTNHGFIKMPGMIEGIKLSSPTYNEQNFNYDLVAETDKWMKSKLKAKI
ncbi:alpha/beta fold hydrolase [Adhaeribacter terreus]|uniref:Alpha/beta fold hydrolase n=1 Tax=Adhaeribacter terreus TaxID=529703 RepID=A0ABW0E833_9BACT